MSGTGMAASGPMNTVVVDAAPLGVVGARPSLRDYVLSLFRYRSFILFDSRSRISGANAVNTLGRLWMVLNPILDGGAYFLVFGVLLGTGRGIPNFIAYLIIGVFFFRYSSQAITAGSKAVSSNLTLVRAFRFPRATLVLATNLRALLEFVPTLAVMFVLILAIPPLEVFTWRWLLLVPLLALQTLFNVGLSLVLARFVAHWPDLANLIAFGMRIWLYLSAVFFSVERFDAQPIVQTAMHLNPLYCVLDIARQSLLYGQDAEPHRWLVLAGWAALVAVVGLVVFWRAEETYGEER